MKNHVLCGSVVLLLLCERLLAHAQPSWQEVATSEGVRISYRIEACHEQTYMALQVENTNSQPVNLDYEIMLPNAHGEMMAFTAPQHLFVEASQTLTGSCSDPYPELYILLYDEFTRPSRVEITLKTQKL